MINLSRSQIIPAQRLMDWDKGNGGVREKGRNFKGKRGNGGEWESNIEVKEN